MQALLLMFDTKTIYLRIPNFRMLSKQRILTRFMKTGREE